MVPPETSQTQNDYQTSSIINNQLTQNSNPIAWLELRASEKMQEDATEVSRDKVNVKSNAEGDEDSDPDDGAVYESSRVTEEEKEDVTELFDGPA